MSDQDLERSMTQNEHKIVQERELDEVLARARAVFADRTEDELMDEIAQVIDEVRAEQRRESVSPTTA
jgi:hypothetical protein